MGKTLPGLPVHRMTTEVPEACKQTGLLLGALAHGLTVRRWGQSAQVVDWFTSVKVAKPMNREQSKNWVSGGMGHWSGGKLGIVHGPRKTPDTVKIL